MQHGHLICLLCLKYPSVSFLPYISNRVHIDCRPHSSLCFVGTCTGGTELHQRPKYTTRTEHRATRANDGRNRPASRIPARRMEMAIARVLLCFPATKFNGGVSVVTQPWVGVVSRWAASAPASKRIGKLGKRAVGCRADGDTIRAGIMVSLGLLQRA